MESSGASPQIKKKRVKSSSTKEMDKKILKKWRESQKLKTKLEEQAQIELEEQRTALKNRVKQLKRVANERDQLLERIEIKKDQLLAERDQFLEKVREKESRLELMEKMVENCKRLVKDLPPNSFYRCPLLAYLVVGLENSFVMEFFGISKRTLDRIFENPGNKLVETKCAVNVKRKRVTQTRAIGRNSEDIG